MRYREHRLPPPLDALIECVWFLTSEPGDTDAVTEQRILPDGCIELICHFGGRFLEVSRVGVRAPQPSCFVVGLLTSPLVVQPCAGADTMGVRCRPGCASLLVETPLAALADRAVSLDQLWGQGARDLWDRLAAASSDASRIDRLSRALLARLARTEIDRRTMSAVGELVRSAGRARVSSVAARTGVTMRQLQRRFDEQVGASPKVLARILRFQNTLRQRATFGDGRTDWVRVAIECGYADQSHLIHDYATFAGHAPASLRAAEGELSAYFTAPQRLAALFDGRRYG